MDYLKPQLLILIPMLVGFGQFAKRRGMKAKAVPFFLLGIGILIATSYGLIVSTYAGWRMFLDAIVITGICQGGVAAFTAMGLYDTAKSTKKE